jgi:hypothetical protein
VASDLPRSPPKSSVFTVNDLSVGRNHELYSVTYSVVVNSVDIFFQVDVCFGADPYTLAGRLPLVPQPYKIASSSSEAIAVFDFVTNQSIRSLIYPSNFAAGRARLFLHSCRPSVVSFSGTESMDAGELRLGVSWI